VVYPWTDDASRRATVDRVLLRANEAADALGVSRSKVYELLASGRLRSVNVDGARRVPCEAVREFVAGLEAEVTYGKNGSAAGSG
jgi:excisionase family DNA binding protein